MKAPGILAVVIVILAAACGSSGGSAKPTATVRSSATQTVRTAMPALHDASNETIEFTSASFVDSRTGWVGGFIDGKNGGAIFKTADDGRTWHRDYSGPKGIGGVQFIDAENGWAIIHPNRGDYGVDPYVILHTTNGGSSWQQVSRHRYLGYLQFFTPLYGRALFTENDGPERLFETSDAGRTWTVLSSPVELANVCFVDQNNGLAAGRDGRVYRTADGARTWQFSFAAPSAIVTPVTEKSLGVAYVQCSKGSVAWANFSDGAVRGSGVLYRTSDGGTNWSIVAEHGLPKLQAAGVGQGGLGNIVMVNLRAGYSFSTCEPCGSNRVTISTTADGGASWSRSATIEEITTASGMSFADESHGWIVGYRDDFSTNSTPLRIENYPLILATSNGGKTWEQQYP